jgi:hypothetical protein
VDEAIREPAAGALPDWWCGWQAEGERRITVSDLD